MPDSKEGLAIDAIIAGDVEALDRLLDHGVDINHVLSGDDWNFLHMALQDVNPYPGTRVNPDMVRYLVAHGVDVDAPDRLYGYTPLHYAARTKHPEVLEILAKAVSNIDPVNKDGYTPLRMALYPKPYVLEAVEVLLNHGADPEHKSEPAPPRYKDMCTVRELAQMISHGENAHIIELFDRYPPKST